MLRRICLLVNYNLYESKRYFTEQLHGALLRYGLQSRIFDVQEEELNPSIAQEIHNFRPDLTCSFNSFSPTRDQKFLWDILKIPHWSILVDPLFYSLNLMTSPLSIISSVDRTDCRILYQSQFPRSFFWPHAIESNLPESREERTYDVVFIGSCYDYQSMRNFFRAHYSDEVNAAFDVAVDLVLSDQNISIPQALVTAWNQAHISLEKDVDYHNVLYFLDIFTRGLDRIELIRNIKDTTVHIFGDLLQDQIYCKMGWRDYLLSQPNVIIHPPVSYGESLAILQKSKICLNSTPFFKDGSHERVFAGFATGALPLTSENVYWKERFQEGEEILFYRHGAWEEANEMVQHILQNEKKRQSMVERGRQKVMTNDTWDQRVQQLVTTLPPLLSQIRIPD